MDDDLGRIFVPLLIGAAVAIFVGSRIWIALRK